MVLFRQGITLLMGQTPGIVLSMARNSGIVLLMARNSGIVLLMARNSWIVLLMARNSEIVLLMARNSGIWIKTQERFYHQFQMIVHCTNIVYFTCSQIITSHSIYNNIVINY